ncbi:MAG: LytR/AlgR family response regulator transcription factor [Peptococcaceae bacterium]
MNIVICDDIVTEAETTAAFVQRYYQQRNLPLPQITLVQTGQQLRAQQAIDLVFLDIELAQESGIALAAELNRTSPATIVVFVSSYPVYVTDAYTVNAAQFFVKPLREDVFQQEFTRILQRCQTAQEQFTRKCNGEDVILHRRDIVYICSYKRVLKVFLSNSDTLEYYGKISDEEQFFAGSSIIRCHKSYLVNLDYVYGFDAAKIIMQFPDKQQQEICIGENWRKTVKSAFLHYLNQ